MKSYQGELRISRAGSWLKLGVSLELILHLASSPDPAEAYSSNQTKALITKIQWLTAEQWPPEPPHPPPPRTAEAQCGLPYLRVISYYSNWSHLGYPSSKIQWLMLGCGSELAHFPSTLQALCFISALRGKKKHQIRWLAMKTFE